MYIKVREIVLIESLLSNLAERVAEFSTPTGNFLSLGNNISVE